MDGVPPAGDLLAALAAQALGGALVVVTVDGMAGGVGGGLDQRVDRRLAGWLRGTPVEATYAGRREPGFLALVRTITGDPQTWRDLGWLVGLALSSATLAMLGITLQYLTSPLWSWAINDPESHYGLTNLVLFTNDTLVEAFAVAGIGLLLAPITLLLAHACVARESRRRPTPFAGADPN